MIPIIIPIIWIFPHYSDVVEYQIRDKTADRRSYVLD